MDEPRIDRLHLASLTAPAGHPSAGSAIDVYAYLVRLPGLTLLVDTGMGDGNAFLDKLYTANRTDLSESLGRVGVAPGDIDAVANSHLHFDHCGGNHLFPGTPLYIQARECAAAREPHYTVKEWIAPAGVTVSELDGDHEIAPGVTLLSTPGHTPGHQSVALEMPEGLVIIAAQAAYTAAEFDGVGDTAEAHENMGDAYLGSIARLKSLKPARVLFSHDWQEWQPAA